MNNDLDIDDLDDLDALIETLQDHILPAGLPVLPRLDVSAHFAVSAAPGEATGAWFDVLPLRSGPTRAGRGTGTGQRHGDSGCGRRRRRGAPRGPTAPRGRRHRARAGRPARPALRRRPRHQRRARDRRPRPRRAQLRDRGPRGADRAHPRGRRPPARPHRPPVAGVDRRRRGRDRAVHRRRRRGAHLGARPARRRRPAARHAARGTGPRARRRPWRQHIAATQASGAVAVVVADAHDESQADLDSSRPATPWWVAGCAWSSRSGWPGSGPPRSTRCP